MLSQGSHCQINSERLSLTIGSKKGLAAAGGSPPVLSSATVYNEVTTLNHTSAVASSSPLAPVIIPKTPSHAPASYKPLKELFRRVLSELASDKGQLLKAVVHKPADARVTSHPHFTELAFVRG